MTNVGTTDPWQFDPDRTTRKDTPMKLMVYIDSERRYFIAPSGLYTGIALRQRVSPFYANSSAAEAALVVKQREYNAAA